MGPVKNPLRLSSFLPLIYLFVLLLLPLILLTVILLLITRALLTLYKNLLRPDMGDLLSGVNNLYSGDSPYDNPIVIVSSYIFIRGHLSLPDLTQLMRDTMDGFNRHKTPLYPELHQFPTTLAGFSVWKNENNFSLEDHFLSFDPEELNTRLKWRTDGDWTFKKNAFNLVTEENVADLCFSLTRVPFPKGKSPWEVILHHNVRLKGEETPTTLMFWRFHHTLTDALSGVNLLSKLTDDKDLFEKFVGKFSKSVVRVKRSLPGKLIYGLTYPFLGIYELLAHILEVWDDNVWHQKWPPKFRTEFNYTTFDTVSTEKVKGIRRVQGDVKFFSILLASLTGGIRKYMSQRGISIPREMHAIVSVPIPKDPNKLTNSVTGTVFRMPVGENDRTKVVRMIDRESIYFKTSRLPLTFLAVFSFLGLLPRKLLMHYWFFTTVGTSNFPGFDSQVKLNGLPVLSIRALASLPATTGIYFWVCGYMGNLEICLGVSKDIMPSMEDVRECRRYVQEEFEALENPDNKLIVPINEMTSRRKVN